MYRRHCYTSYLINIVHLLVLHHCSHIIIYKEKACHLASVYFEKHGLRLVVALPHNSLNTNYSISAPLALFYEDFRKSKPI
jgi:hypothetical protein